MRRQRILSVKSLVFIGARWQSGFLNASSSEIVERACHSQPCKEDRMKALLKRTFFLSALFVLAVSTAHATIDPATAQKLLADDGAANDLFGYSVSVSGDTAIIGAPYDDNFKGSAYAFARDADGSWNQQQKLQAGDRAVGDLFGNSVSVSGDTVIIGAFFDDNYKGSAYAFTRATDGSWSEQQKLLAGDGATNDLFGNSVSVSGDTAIIGAPNDDNYKGSAYAFTRAADGSWSQQPKLQAGDGAAGDNFGNSVSVSGDTALIGALGADSWAGAAYAFTGSDGIWSQQQKLTATEGTATDEDMFGSSVTLSSDGSIALIGAAFYAGEQGAAYIFIRSGDLWSQQQRLTASEGMEMDGFGCSVSLSSDADTALVGAYGDDSEQGAAYIFTGSGGIWSQQQMLTVADGTAGDRFGLSVAVSGDTVVVGAYFDDDKGDDSGSAYVFTQEQVSQERINMVPIYMLLL
ncbi:FG-GAP repeat-containing protein [Candidatus Electrothrix laxa]